MNAEQLRERIGELERQRNMLAQQHGELTNAIVRAEGALMELRRWLAELESEDDDGPAETA